MSETTESTGSMHAACAACISFAPLDNRDEATEKAADHDEYMHKETEESVAGAVDVSDEEELREFIELMSEHADEADFEQFIEDLRTGDAPFYSDDVLFDAAVPDEYK